MAAIFNPCNAIILKMQLTCSNWMHTAPRPNEIPSLRRFFNFDDVRSSCPTNKGGDIEQCVG